MPEHQICHPVPFALSSHAHGAGLMARPYLKVMPTESLMSRHIVKQNKSSADNKRFVPKTPVRRCLVSHTSKPKDRLVRFVIDPTGTIVPDIACRLPGRGFYITATHTALTEAVRKKVFARAARLAVTVPDDLVSRTNHLLRRHFLNLLGMARKRGQIITGFERVVKDLSSRRVKVLLTAEDGSRDGVRKLTSKSPMPLVTLIDPCVTSEPWDTYRSKDDAPVGPLSKDTILYISFLTRAELAQTIGISGDVVHTAVICEDQSGFVAMEKIKSAAFCLAGFILPGEQDQVTK